RAAARTLGAEVGPDGLRCAEQAQGRVDQVRAQVVQHTAAGPVHLGPAGVRPGLEPVEASDECAYLPDQALLDAPPDRQLVRVPAALVEHAQCQTALPRERDEV